MDSAIDQQMILFGQEMPKCLFGLQ